MTTPVWEQGMNPEQLQAIRHQDGPAVVKAVAGAGKTRAVVHRMVRMVNEGVRGEKILAVTFSKKAADEMSERARSLGVVSARVGTWHSLCLQILRDDSTVWADYEIDDRDRAKFILKDVVGYKHLNWPNVDFGALRSWIGVCKANLADPMTTLAEDLAAAAGLDAELAMKAFDLYQNMVENRGLLTFDDYLVFTHRHLSREENRLRWANRWSYLIQDEYQDTNVAQKEIAKLLARDHRNYMVVGDPAQSIYAFRGSGPQHIENFPSEWGVDTAVIVMNRNYRSGSTIIDTANKVIAPAQIKLPVDMLAERGTPGEVRTLVSPSLDEEGEGFVHWIGELRERGTRYGDITALFRTNAQSRALEESLLSAKIPYVVVGGSSFYERKEVKDLLAYLRIAVGRDADGDGVKRCLNAPFRYLGVAFVDRVMDLADRVKGPRNWTAIVRQAGSQQGVQRRQSDSAMEWASLIDRVSAYSQSKEPRDRKPSTILTEVVTRTGYIQWLEKEEGPDSMEASHAANVRELIRVAERFSSIDELLSYIEKNIKAAERQRRDKQSGGDRVLLMSIHKSKGLEWPYVFVSGCNEMVLPHARGDIEEERRLMYVAVTRARDGLMLSYVKRFARPDGVRDALPSRFLVDAGLAKWVQEGYELPESEYGDGLV